MRKHKRPQRITMSWMCTTLRRVDGYHLYGGPCDVRHVARAIERMLNKG